MDDLDAPFFLVAQCRRASMFYATFEMAGLMCFFISNNQARPEVCSLLMLWLIDKLLNWRL